MWRSRRRVCASSGLRFNKPGLTSRSQQYEAPAESELPLRKAMSTTRKPTRLDPKSPSLANVSPEMYGKRNVPNDAELEAQALLKPTLKTRKRKSRTARPHLICAAAVTKRAKPPYNPKPQSRCQQFKEGFASDPSDIESALWLARLYRLQNQHDKAEEVLRGILKKRFRERGGSRAADAIAPRSRQGRLTRSRFSKA